MSEEEQTESDAEAEDEPAAPMLRSPEEANRLVTDNLLLAHKFVRKWLWTRIDPEELLSLATLGLVRASKGYDPDKAAFSTYAWQWMEREVREVHRINKTARRGGGTVATHQIGVDEDGKSYDVPDDHDTDEGLVDVAESVEVAMKGLSSTEQEVVRARYLEGKTLEQIGDERGVTKERIRQIETKALRRCRFQLSPPPCAILPAASDPVPDLPPPPPNCRAVVKAKTVKTRPSVSPVEAESDQPDSPALPDKPFNAKVVVEDATGQMWPSVSALAAELDSPLSLVFRSLRSDYAVNGRRFRRATDVESVAYAAKHYKSPALPAPVRHGGVSDDVRPLLCDQFPDVRFTAAEAAETAGVSVTSVYLSANDDRATGRARLNFRWVNPPSWAVESMPDPDPVAKIELKPTNGTPVIAGPGQYGNRLDDLIARQRKLLAAAEQIRELLTEFPELADVFGPCK